MSTTTEKLRGLVEAVYSRTASNNISWAVTADKDRVYSKINGFQLEINEEPGNDSFEKDIRFTVYDSEGNQVDTFTDQSVNGPSPQVGEHRTYFALMSSIFEMASRQASGADKAIEAILMALGGEPVTEPFTVKSRFPGDVDDDIPF